MRQLTCDMCGSTDLMKQDGVFVCQSCGTKYSVEEAKKMMVEGTVDVQGTVKVDNSAFVEKCLANARRAKEREDWVETEKYYNIVEQNDPDNIEAIFYSAYGKAKQTLTDGDIYKRQASFKVLKNCISIIDDHYKPERRAESKEAILAITVDLGKMITSSFVFTEWKNGYGNVIKTNKNETVALFADLLCAFRETINKIQQVDDQLYLHEVAINLYAAAKHTDYWEASLLNEWIGEERARIESIFKKSELTKGDILQRAYDALLGGLSDLALCFLSVYEQENRNSPIEHLAKAVVYMTLDKQEESVHEVIAASQYTDIDGEIDYVRRLASMPAGCHQRTLLINAAWLANYDAVNYLVDIGSEINAKDGYGRTALWYVCYLNFRSDTPVRIAELLLENGASVDITDRDGVALYNANTKTEIAKMIKAQYPNLQEGMSSSCRTPGCYVATAVYGSYDCPQVWTLRRFRDYTLAETWYGRAFIRTYYAISPTLVKWFGHTDWFKKMWKGKLDRMVADLNAEGVEDTPYEDKEW